ncbi:MAG: serine hydrolase [Solirubrobacterales bacterium]
MKRHLAVLVALTVLLLGPSHATADGERVITHQEARSWSPDARPAREYAESRAGDVSFSVFDMRGRQRQFGGYGSAYMASTFKVMLLVAYLRRAGDRGLTGYDRSLLEPMIRRSDNETASRIDAMLGRGPIENLASDAGMKSFRWHNTWGLSRSTPRDQALFMRTLEQYVPDRHWDYARGLLASIIPSQRWGIGQVDLHGWHLHFKGGWGSGTGWVNHQVVLLAKDGRRIGLAVFTERSPSHAYGKDTLEGVFRRLLDDLPR